MAEPKVLINLSKNGPPIVGWTDPSPSMGDSPKSAISKILESPESIGTLTEDLSTPIFENIRDLERNNNDGNENRSLISMNDTFDSDESEDEERSLQQIADEKKIPDGGFGWVVVAASFIVSMIADGISYSFGLLFIQLQNHFQTSKAVTAWIGSLFLAVPLLSGPLCSALVDRFGCRSMTIVGAAISGLGFVFSAYIDSIWAMYFTFGVLSGIGLGLCYVTAVVSIAYWFDKKRTLAVGLGACGTGIGTFLYAPLTQILIHEYTWRGAILILGGTMFNMAVCGALMKEPDWFRNERENNGPEMSTNCGSQADYPGVEAVRKMIEHGVGTPNGVLANQNINKVQSSHSVVSLPTFIRQNEKVPIEVIDKLREHGDIYRVILDNYPSMLHCKSISSQTGLNDSKYLQQITSPKKNSTHFVNKEVKLNSSKDIKESSPPAKRANSLSQPGGYLKHIKVKRNSVMYRGAMLNIRKYRLKTSSCPDILRNSMTTLAKDNEESWRKELEDILRDMSDFSMFQELHFFLVSISTTLVFTWFIVPYLFLADYMKQHNYNETDASSALVVIGITNTIGMVSLGWLGDQKWVSVSKTYSICLFATGLFTLLMPPLIDSYIGLMTVTACFGFFFSSSYSFTPSLLVELIPLDRFTIAYGLSLLCQGIGNLIGPPIAGWISDVTGSWDKSFYIAGIGLIISGALIAFVPMTENRRLCGKGLLEKDRE